MSFNPTEFKANYPEFVSLSDATLNYRLTEVELLVSPFLKLLNTQTQKDYYTDLTMAHVCRLAQKKAVGRVANASEGSVSGTFNYSDLYSSEFWTQTQYGNRVWQLAKKRGGATYYASCE